MYESAKIQNVVVLELPFNKQHTSSLEIIAQVILKVLLAVGTILEGRADVASALERVPSINLCVADDTREMCEQWKALKYLAMVK